MKNLLVVGSFDEKIFNTISRTCYCMGTNNIIVVNSTLALLKNILAVTAIQRTEPSVLLDYHQYFDTETDIVDKLCRILKSWGIGASSLPIGIEMLKDIPCPSIALLDGKNPNRPGGRLSILLEINDEGTTILDSDEHAIPYNVSMDALSSKWSGLVIVLDLEYAASQRGYKKKIKERDELLSKAGGVSVLMPVYNQGTFVYGAINSLLAQTFSNWELILIDDGSNDNFYEVIEGFLHDRRVRFYKNKQNEGLGYCLNRGLELATHQMVAYLPADDIYYRNHLQSLVEALVTTKASLVYSGVLHHFSHQLGDNYGVKSFGKIQEYPLQLVQVMHIKTDDRWMERAELVTDDLYRMYWHNFYNTSQTVLGTQQISCEWVDHAKQRHKIINDRIGGGIYLYKKTYGVANPIRFQSSVGNLVDEIRHFQNFREDKPSTEVKQAALKILLVGELAYNPERIYAFEEKGHKLYGLWIENPANFNTIGPLPFGNVEDIPLNNWKQRVEQIQPDIIYALLNYHAVPLAYQVLIQNPGIPFVWHFKEGPFFCRSFGSWNQLIKLYSKSDGQIYTNQVVYEWFRQYLPEGLGATFILDGDLPKIDWFSDDQSPLLSEKDGEVHTVVAGRPVGLLPEDIKQMADQKIHLHLYGDIFYNQFKEIIDTAKRIAPHYIHLHPNCPHRDWTKEFSQYDAGWLHFFKSENQGEIRKASWHDLNLPARMSTYAMAGIPMLVKDNAGHRVACQEVLEQHDMALTFKSFDTLQAIFDKKERVMTVRRNVWNKRHLFSFDHHVDDLIAFFREVINRTKPEILLGAASR